MRATVSIGAAHVADASVTADAAVSVADALLYAAKHAGRNRAEIGLAAPPASVAPNPSRPPLGAGRIATQELSP